MKREILEHMTDSELREYAAVVGFEAEPETARKAIIDGIMHRENRTISVEAAGLSLTVDIANMNDIRIAEIQGKDKQTIADLEMFARYLFGETQEKVIRDYVTDERGRVDGAAYAFIVGKMVDQVKGKN